MDAGHRAHDGLCAGEPADQAAALLDPARAGKPEQYRKQAEYLASINLSAVEQLGISAQDPAAPHRPAPPTSSSPNTICRARRSSRMTCIVDEQGMVWYSDFGELFISKFDPKTLKLTEYPVKEFKPGCPGRQLSTSSWTSSGTFWFDTMYQGALGNLDPKTGEIKYYPLRDGIQRRRRAAQLRRAAPRRRRQGVDQERRHQRRLPRRPRDRASGSGSSRSRTLAGGTRTRSTR